MFYTKLEQLANNRNVSVSSILVNLGISKGNIISWKKGTIPSGDMLIKFSKYFDCSVDYFLGLTEQKKIHPSSTDERINSVLLSDDNCLQLIEKIINLPSDIRANAVKDIDNYLSFKYPQSNLTEIRIAARSGHKETLVVDKEELKKDISIVPEADDLNL